MNLSPSITAKDEITLVTLQNCPTDLDFTAKVFQEIGKLGVDVDMISLVPSQGSSTSISFTVRDCDIDKVLSFTSKLHSSGDVKAIVSSGNCKISVSDRNMKNTPGVAAQVFAATADAHADIRMITTSEVDVSMLVTSADFAETLKLIQAAFPNK
jgi:aspartate kinase